mgnify:CR=1 FL=1
MGYASSFEDEFVSAFINLCNSKSDIDILELGAGYGLISEKVATSKNRLVVNDISMEHLEDFRNRLPEATAKCVSLAPGSFPNDLSFQNESLNVIFTSRMVHLLSPKNLIKGINLIYKWLKPNGLLILTADTPFLGFIKDFMPTYLKRVKNNHKWPGKIHNLRDYASDRKNELPRQANFLDKETLQKVIGDKFKIIQASYVNRPDFPDDIKLDGRETIGIIAQKVS